jgi:predicted MPP superfamily phosphohydrolase
MGVKEIAGKKGRLLSRRNFMKATFAGALAATSTFSYGRTRGVHHLVVEHVTVRIPGLAPARDGTRIALLADLHAGNTSSAHLEHAFDLALNLEPQFIVIPGDIVDSNLNGLAGLQRIVARATRQAPTYGSTGNHDFAHSYVDLSFSNKVSKAMEEAGVRMLRNAFHQPRTGPGELCFVGLEDYWSRHMDPSTLDRAPSDASVILLSHNPDTYESVADYRWHLMLSGHTHGGQVCIPGYGPLILPVKHRERSQGLFHLDPGQPDRALYVTRGAGHGFKLRLFCPPEVTCLTLQRA